MEHPVAIIPARGGSKRVPRKNIRPFCGVPIIHWPLRAAHKSGLFARIAVSTDDAEIAEMARNGGAEVPFLRNPELADDVTGTAEVVRDAIMQLALPPETPVCCFYATSIFVDAEDFCTGYASLRSDEKPSWVFTIAPYRSPVRRAYEMNDGKLMPIHPEAISMRSQDLPPAFFDAGQFYWARASTWMDPTIPMWSNAAPLILDPDRVVDIDTLSDWSRAEQIFSENAPTAYQE